ncbi:unnamed protein product [Didymodactylos carnosus]|uniref:Mab-21-like nucleotidyltransferase domain-containing protein n=1 Tax=Didymodactylos carnosus TaxID=1234261 RepID=A0A8S2H5M0_9BILA|nr:unnamed protein product [Didymodactylos carnosus]CAF3597885.1 unnamed protein product [Didymodactylos carnosus]
MKGNLTNSSEMSSSTTLKPPLPSPTALNDDLAFVSGSTVERQAYARHYKNQNVQDYDIMVVHGFISSPTALIQTSIPGFKQILFEPIQKLGSLSCLTGTLNSTGQLCLNGLQMKMYHKVKNETPFVVDSAGIVTTTDKTDLTAIVTHTSTTDSTAASVAVTVTREPLPFENDLTQILPNWLHHQQPLSVPTHVLKERFYKFSRGYMDAISHYTLPLLINEHVREMATEWNTNEQRFYDLLNIIGPVYGYRLPQKIKQQLQLIFDFYDKHKHLAHSSKIKETIDYVNYCLPKEIDLVPAIQIKGFWPDDVQPFLERFRKNCPHLYNELISKTSMHLIAKWSKKTSAIDQELEFRYSFSALERLLADKRTQNEQILNGIARSIYYRYLTKTSGSNLIPSYFVKTTVLWMCETMSDLINNIVGDNAESIARQLGFEWIKFN